MVVGYAGKGREAGWEGGLTPPGRPPRGYCTGRGGGAAGRLAGGPDDTACLLQRRPPHPRMRWPSAQRQRRGGRRPCGRRGVVAPPCRDVWSAWFVLSACFLCASTVPAEVNSSTPMSSPGLRVHTLYGATTQQRAQRTTTVEPVVPSVQHQTRFIKKKENTRDGRTCHLSDPRCPNNPHLALFPVCNDVRSRRGNDGLDSR